MSVTLNPWNWRWVHTPSSYFSFSIENDFTGLRTIELEVVILRPGLYVVEFSVSDVDDVVFS